MWFKFLEIQKITIDFALCFVFFQEIFASFVINHKDFELFNLKYFWICPAFKLNQRPNFKFVVYNYGR